MTDQELLNLLYSTMASQRRRLKDIADDLNVQAGSICRWRKTNKLSAGSRKLIAVWLAGQGVSLEPAQVSKHAPEDALLLYVETEWVNLTPAERAEVVAVIERAKARKQTSDPHK
jgi:hypothetical protein